MRDHSEAAATLPGFLLLSLPGDFRQDALMASLTSAVPATGGQVLAVGAALDNACLEIGTRPKSVVIAVWDSQASAIDAWHAMTSTIPATGDMSELVALAGTCLAEEGLAGFPTREAAAPVKSPGPPAYMLIEGTVTAPEPMSRYRDIIFPMISERGAYYVVYAARTNVKILQGDWQEDALIVSRWPDADKARDFWFCDRYQTIAIPTRAGAGKFSVVLVPAAPDAARHSLSGAIG